MGSCIDRTIRAWDAEYVGEIPVRQDIVVLPADVPKFIAVSVVKHPEDACRLDLVPDGCLKVWDDEILSIGRNKRPVPEPEPPKMVPHKLGFVIKETIGIVVLNTAAVDKVEIEVTPDGCLKVWDDEILSIGER